MIYLQKIIKKYFLQYFVIFLVLVLVYYLGLFFNYFKYNNKNVIDNKLLEIDNQYLKNELNNIKDIYKINYDVNYDISKVLYRDLYNNNTIIISNNDYNVGDLVINQDGLIGIINLISDKCYVELLSNDLNLSVKINDNYGILNNSVISMIDKYADINIGDKVYTSGLTNIVGDIYVGEVIKTYSSYDNLGKMAIIKLVNSDNLNYVGVIRSNV